MATGYSLVNIFLGAVVFGFVPCVSNYTGSPWNPTAYVLNVASCGPLMSSGSPLGIC